MLKNLQRPAVRHNVNLILNITGVTNIIFAIFILFIRFIPSTFIYYNYSKLHRNYLNFEIFVIIMVQKLRVCVKPRRKRNMLPFDKSLRQFWLSISLQHCLNIRTKWPTSRHPDWSIRHQNQSRITVVWPMLTDILLLTRINIQMLYNNTSELDYRISLNSFQPKITL